MSDIRDDSHKKMDWLARMWERCGRWFSHRPAAVLGTLAGAVLFAALMGVLIFRQNEQATNLREVQSAFCNGAIKNPTKVQQANCQHLLDQLLKDPTPIQAERLRQIIKEAP